MPRGSRIFELYGSNLAGDPSRFSIQANGVSVNTLYVSVSQINFILPDEVTGTVTIQVTTDKGSDQITM